MKRSALLILSLFAPRALFAQEAVSGTPEPSGASLFDLISQGGWAMIPLGICLLATLFLFFFAIFETMRGRFIPDALIGELSIAMQQRDLASAREKLSDGKTVLSRALGKALAKARPDVEDANREKVEGTLVENLESEENSVGQWINYLNVIASIAPMIGLLGTVGGMIGAFQVMASGGMGKPELLAGNIGEALITTAAGLCIGIPAMLAYFFFRNRLNNQMIATTQAATLLIDYLAGDIRVDEQS